VFPGPDLVYELSGLILWSTPGLHASQDHSIPSHQGRPWACQTLGPARRPMISMDCRISETFWHASATDGSILEGLNTILEMSVDNRGDNWGRKESSPGVCRAGLLWD
jgi:hypothetical protein